MEQKSIQRYISKLSNKVRRRLDVLSGQYGALTGAEGRVLNYLLAQNADQFQRDIEEEFDLRASTASEMLNSMERKGFIVRQPIAEDARMKKIVITPLGLSFQKQVQADLAEMDAKITAGISDKDMECFFHVAETMLKNLSD